MYERSGGVKHLIYYLKFIEPLKSPNLIKSSTKKFDIRPLRSTTKLTQIQSNSMIYECRPMFFQKQSGFPDPDYYFLTLRRFIFAL